MKTSLMYPHSQKIRNFPLLMDGLCKHRLCFVVLCYEKCTKSASLARAMQDCKMEVRRK